MKFLPSNKEEIDLIKFIAKFQYLSINDIKYFFKTDRYYRKRITRLVSNMFIRRLNNNLVLGEFGIEYVKALKYEYTPLNRNPKYFPRLEYISNLGAFYNKVDEVKFTPSYSIKDKEIFTAIARKFIGILEINGIEYLTYHISEEHDNKYLMSVVYDIEKEKKYKNIIVLIDDLKRINLKEFAFGNNQVIVLEDTEENRNKLKYINSINWPEMIYKFYKNNVHITEYIFCDYTDNKEKYISVFSFIDTEKINRIRVFLRENKKNHVEIICSKELEEILKREIPEAIIFAVDLEPYIIKEIYSL